MKLYTMPNTCALAPHIVIKWTGLDIEVEVMPSGGSRLPAYLAINPHGKVPALVLDDGSILTEAAAILPLLADLAPKVELGGSDLIERARVAEALGFMVGEVHSDWTPHFAPQRYLTNDEGHPELERLSNGWSRNMRFSTPQWVTGPGCCLDDEPSQMPISTCWLGPQT
jgi:glutathione S-transferase